jgi:hypothetical protein
MDDGFLHHLAVDAAEDAQGDGARMRATLVPAVGSKASQMAVPTIAASHSFSCANCAPAAMPPLTTWMKSAWP